MHIALFPNDDKPDTFQIAQAITDFFLSKNVALYAPDSAAQQLKIKTLSAIEPTQIDLMISMGGDGTILRLAHDYRHIEAAIVGINLGYLGFMADIPISDLIPSLEDILQNRYTVENRIMLEGRSPRGQHHNAINDFVIHRGRNPSLIELSVDAGAHSITTFKADGIIIATPNGSTAYSLAAGGPILTPDLDAFVITPISAHTISNRPIVVSAKSEIAVTYKGHAGPVEVVADGLHSYELHANESIHLTKSAHPFKLVNLNRRDYFTTLRTKLGWSGKTPSAKESDCQ